MAGSPSAEKKSPLSFHFWIYKYTCWPSERKKERIGLEGNVSPMRTATDAEREARQTLGPSLVSRQLGNCGEGSGESSLSGAVCSASSLSLWATNCLDAERRWRCHSSRGVDDDVREEIEFVSSWEREERAELINSTSSDGNFSVLPTHRRGCRLNRRTRANPIWRFFFFFLFCFQEGEFLVLKVIKTRRRRRGGGLLLFSENSL